MDEDMASFCSRNEMETILNSMRKNKEIFEMQIKEISEMLYCRYQSLQEAGFTKEQAFKIILTRGMA